MPDHMVQHNGIPDHSHWCDCLDCRDYREAWEDWHEAKYLWRLAEQDEQVRQAKPATDAEWAAFFDAEFPRVKEGVTS